MTNILPLPVKKNKFGQRVAEISVTKYYRQIEEEILEAFKEAVTAENTDKLSAGHIIPTYEYEAEELVDIIACCVTRMDIVGISENFLLNTVERAEYNAEDLQNLSSRDWYLKISVKALESYAEGKKLEDFYKSELDEMVGEIKYTREAKYLAEIIDFCIGRLENIGYDETARRKIYKAVNEKNQRRGYFED